MADAETGAVVNATWATMILAGIGTYVLRASMLVAHDVAGTPAWLERRLPLVGPSIVAVMVVSSLSAGGSTAPTPTAVVAVAAAFMAVRRTGRLGSALVVGFPVAWITGALLQLW
ncbi:MAG: hypothetical protein HKN41_08625 [Ilumatobacter sp.]|nr:hypothetical protein [Ilumatobacter sp.]